MLIHQVCQACGLTKKAIAYYETKGLIAPKTLENGYRSYSQAEIHTLKEIWVLRTCGMGTAEIQDILTSKNKSAQLEKHIHLIRLREQRLRAVQRCMDSLIADYDVESAFQRLRQQDEDIFTIREKLILAFPGSYGLFLSLHFGRFLEGSVDTEKKRRACDEIIAYLDSVQLNLDPKLAIFLEDYFALEVTQFEDNVNGSMLELLENPEDYFHRHQGEIEEYQAFVQSPEFQRSPAAELKKKLQEFQLQSGYREKLVENMKVLSPAYREYCGKLDMANQQYLRLFSETEENGGR